MKLRNLIAVVAVPLLLLLAACSSGNAQPADTPASGKVPSTIRIGSPEKVTSFDPTVHCCETSYGIDFLVNAYLTTYGVKGGVDDNSVAKSFTASEDGLTWTVKIRSGITFTDGSPLTADDVAASLNYSRRPASVAAYVGRDIKDVTAEDSQTVQISMLRPRPTLPELLSAPVEAIFPAKGLQNPDEFFRAPISAGKYIMDSADIEGGKFAFSRNSQYFGTAPKAEHVELTAGTSITTLAAQLKTGQIDHAMSLDPSLEPQFTGAIKPVTVPYVSNVMIFPMASSQVLGDKNIRAAIATAVDREQMSKSLGGLLPPQTGFYPAASGLDTVKPSKPDINKAKALLKGTACENGCTVSMGANSVLWFSNRVVLLLQQQLAPIGITVKVTNNAQVGAAITSGKGLDAIVDYAIPFHDTALSWLDHTLRSNTGWGALTGLKDATADRLADEFNAATSEDQKKIAQEVSDYVTNENPVIPLLEYRRLDATTLPAGTVNVVLGWKLDLP